MDQETALKILKTGQNVFLTGSAGTGKTFVLNKYISYLKDREVFPAVTAPTGVAASHLDGQTLHSFFGLGIKENINDYDLDNILQTKYLHNRLSKLKILIIDEISMVSPEIFEALDKILRAFKFSPEPFGGVQVVLSGDFFQLPPVSKTRKKIKFVWQTELWKKMDIKTCYLEKKYRQDDGTLIEILDEIRAGNVSENSMNIFRSRYKKNTIGNFKETKLYTHNVDVDKINFEELEKLNTPLKIFKATTSGGRKNVDKIFKRSIVVEELYLKKGALVAFIKNNYEKDYINGTLGIIVDFDDNSGYPLVEITSGRKIIASPDVWHLDSDGKIVGEVKQIPLRLAWALTIHKSQGMTLDAAEIDLSKTFEAGQGYVALSRIKSITGLKLMGLNKTALLVDQNVSKIDKKMKRESKKIFEEIKKTNRKIIEREHSNFLKKIGGSSKKIKKTNSGENLKHKKINTYEKTLELIAKKKSISEISKIRKISKKTILSHLEKIHSQFPETDFDYLRPSQKIINQVASAYETLSSEKNQKENFMKNGQLKLKPLFEILDGKISYEDIKLALLFI